MGHGRAMRSQESALSQEQDVRTQVESLLDVPLAEIVEDPGNERGNMREDLQELALSLKVLGLQERVKLYPVMTGRYVIASGHRRVAAARELGWRTIPAVVSRRPADEVKQAVTRLASNLCRKDIDPISFAISTRYLLVEQGVPIERLAAWLGKSPTTLVGHLRLLELPQDVQMWVSSGMLSVGHGLQLLRVKEPELDWAGMVKTSMDECRVRLGKEAAEEGLSVRALEVRVKNVLTNNAAIRNWLKRQGVSETEHALSVAGSQESTLVLPLRDPEKARAQWIAVRDAVGTALEFEEESGPSLNHLRLAALMLADLVYTSYSTDGTDVPDHGATNREIEKARSMTSVLSIIGTLVKVVVLGSVSFDGEKLVVEGRAKWAKDRFRLTQAVEVALRAADDRG